MNHYRTPSVARCDRCHAPVHSPGLCGECRRLERWQRDQRRGLPTVEMFPEFERRKVRQEDLF